MPQARALNFETMQTTEHPQTKPLRIAPTKAAHDAAPADFDGYVIRRNASSVRLFAFGEFYTLNRHRVFCLESKQPDGRTWFSYGGDLNRRTLSELDDLASELFKP